MAEFNYGALLRHRREAAGLTQDRLGERLGVGRTMISRYERNLNSPTMEQVEIYAAALGMTIEAFLSSPPDRPELGLRWDTAQPTPTTDAAPMWFTLPASLETPDSAGRVDPGDSVSDPAIVTMVGDDMYPYVQDGDLVTVDLRRTRPESGDVVLFKRADGDSGELRRFRVESRERLLVGNPELPPIRVDRSKIEVLGTAIVLKRRLRTRRA